MLRTCYIVLGAPASGKSTYARALAARCGAALVDIDTATEPVVRAALSSQGRDPDDRDSAFFKEHFRQPIYDALFQIARENLGQIDAVVVGPFTSEQRDPDWLGKVAAQLGVPCRVEAHWVTCPPEIRRERMALRANPRDASKLADWRSHQAYYGEQAPPLFEHIKVRSMNEE